MKHSRGNSQPQFDIDRYFDLVLVRKEHISGLDKTHRFQNPTIEARIACRRARLVIASSSYGMTWREELELDSVANRGINGIGQERKPLTDCDDLLCCECQRNETEREGEFGGHCCCDIDSRAGNVEGRSWLLLLIGDDNGVWCLVFVVLRRKDEGRG